MAVTSFQDFTLADADRDCDGDAADKRSASGRTRRMSRTRSTATPTSGTTQITRTTSRRTSYSFAMPSTEASLPYRAR